MFTGVSSPSARGLSRRARERAVGGRQGPEEAGFAQRSSDRGAWRGTGGAYGSRFSTGFGEQAESLEIAEAAGERVLDQPRGEGCRRAPAAAPDQGEDFRVGSGGQQDEQGAGDLNEMEPAQQGGAAALPQGAKAIDDFEISEQGLDAPPFGIILDDGRGGQGGIGGQQQARPCPAAGRLFQLAPPHDDTLEEARAAHGVTPPGRPAGIASDGVNRGGQCRDR